MSVLSDINRRGDGQGDHIGSPVHRGWRGDGEEARHAEDKAGANRQGRMSSLRAGFEVHGISVRHDVGPGLGHEGFALLPRVKTFLAETLTARRAVSAESTTAIPAANPR